MIVLIDNGHGENTKGKQSPDGRLKEWKWSREIAKRLVSALLAKGVDARLLTPEDEDISITTRVNRANSICRTAGAKNVLLVSVHNNAGANGGWVNSTGFSVFCSKNASENSKRCARGFTKLAIERDMCGNRSVPSARYWTWSWTSNDIGILKNSNCPAVLTENFFMDNREDLEYLLSETGKQEIVELHVDAIMNYISH